MNILENPTLYILENVEFAGIPIIFLIIALKKKT